MAVLPADDAGLRQVPTANAPLRVMACSMALAAALIHAATITAQPDDATFPLLFAGAAPAATAAVAPAGSAAAPSTTASTTTTTTPPRAFDPAKPIDLSGTPGVTSAQQARAEDLLRRTLRDLPQWSDPATAEAAGYR